MEMRNLLLGVLIALTTTANAQEIYKNFTNSIGPSTKLTLEVSENTYWLSLVPFSGTNKVGVAIKDYELKRFNSNLENAKKKYIEWSEVAKKNNVTEMAKEVKCPMVCSFKAYFKYGSKWKFHSNANFTYKVMIENGEYKLYLFSEKLTSDDNQFMKHEGGVLKFRSVEEIEEFQKMMNEEKLKEFRDSLKKEEEKKDELFKD